MEAEIKKLSNGQGFFLSDGDRVKHIVEEMLSEINASGPWRTMFKALCGQPRYLDFPNQEQLDSLREFFPNHHEVLDVLAQILDQRWYLKKEPKSFRPILLVGPPGCGKSAFAKALAHSFSEDHCAYLNVAGECTPSLIMGTERSYRNAGSGELLKTMGSRRGGPVLNPVMIIDEVEKASTYKGGAWLEILLPLLEKEDAKQFLDQYFQIPVDASKVNWILLANDISQVSQPLKDRCQIFEISGYSQDQYIQQVIPALYKRWIHRFEEGTLVQELSPEAAGAICMVDPAVSPRSVESHFDRAFSKAIKLTNNLPLVLQPEHFHG